MPSAKTNARNERVLQLLREMGVQIHAAPCSCEHCYAVARQITNAVEGRTDRKGGRP